MKGNSEAEGRITVAGQTSEAVLCGQGRRMVRHKGEFSIGNRNKQ